MSELAPSVAGESQAEAEFPAPVIGALAGAASGLGVVAIFCVVTYEIVSRYFFSSPTFWSVELSTYLLIAVAYFGSAYAHTRGANVRVTLLLDSLPRPLRQILEQSTAWLSLFFVLAAALQTLKFTNINYVNNTKSYVMLVPQWIPNLPILAGLLLLAASIMFEVRSLRGAVGTLREWLAPAFMLIAVAALVYFAFFPLKTGVSPLDWGIVSIALLCAIAALTWSGPLVLLVSCAIGISVFYLLVAVGDADAGAVATVLFILTLVLFFLGFRIAFALGFIALFSLYFLLPFPLPNVIAERAFTSLESFSLTALPMFVLMGSLLVRSGIARELFDALLKWMGRWHGGIAHAAMGACTVFAAVSGSSIATAATIGSVACPEMVRHGYSRTLAYGSVAAGGTLGILIPPSVPLIIYGTLAGVSVSKLFIGAMIPGLLLTFLFMATILGWSVLYPSAVPKGDRASWPDRIRSLQGTGPFLLLIAAVLGSLYFGIVTPTEAGAVGALMAVLLCLYRGKLSPRLLAQSILETVSVVGFILLIVFGASLLTFVFDYLRVSQILLERVGSSGIHGILLFLIICLFYIVLGMFLDSISLITLTLPIVFPLVLSMGLDPVWFGIVLVLLVEIGLITPPVGLNLFVLQGVGNVSLKQVAIGALPFGLVMMAFLVLLYVMPELVTWLPQHIK